MATWASRHIAAAPSVATMTAPRVAAEVGDGDTPHVAVAYQPILDVARGLAAGYQAQARVAASYELDLAAASLLGRDLDGSLTATAAATALAAFATLPRNTFLAVPIGAAVAASAPVRDVLTGFGSLSGIVLDVAGSVEPANADLDAALAEYRDAGAIIAVGGYGAPQPELTNIVRLKPAIIRLGRDWVRGVDNSEAKRSAIELLGTLAGQLDAWILAEGVGTAAELRTLAGLEVPLAQGPFIGAAHQFWPDIAPPVQRTLPQQTASADGVLRGLVQQAYTARDAAAAAAVLPETTGFDVVVVLDDHRRPTSILEQDGGGWCAAEVLAVNVDTPMGDAVARAMLRPRATRFTPLACTDDKGEFLGVLRIEALMTHLADRDT